MEDLRRKELELKQKEEALGKLEADLKLREEAVNGELQKLRELRKEITTVQEEKDKKESQKIEKLVEIFEKMSPRQAALVLAEVEEKLVVEAFERVDSERVAKIMGKMDPVKSSRISELMVRGKVSMRSRKPANSQGSEK